MRFVRWLIASTVEMRGAVVGGGFTARERGRVGLPPVRRKREKGRGSSEGEKERGDVVRCCFTKSEHGRRRWGWGRGRGRERLGQGGYLIKGPGRKKYPRGGIFIPERRFFPRARIKIPECGFFRGGYF